MDTNEIFKLKTLIFVPHYDDEIIGLGGIVGQVVNKDLLNFHFMTDGSKSPSPPFSLSLADQEMLKKVRRSESTNVLKLLGIKEQNLFFAELPETKADRTILLEEIKKILKKLLPKIVIIPFRYDRHRDHVLLSRTVINLVRKSNLNIKVYEYFVYHKWKMLPKKDIRKYIFPEMLLEFDIDNFSDVKKQALNLFKSQTTLYFAWQTRPILTKEFIENNTRENEVLLESNLKLKDMDIFTGSKIRILLVHALEYKMKKIKEEILFFIRTTFRFTFRK